MRRMLWKTSAAIIAVLNLLMMLSGAAPAEPTYIVALGDSLTHGMGVPLDEAFPAQLEKMLRADGFNVQVINAGVDGDTTDRMLMRMNSVIPSRTKVVIVQGGYNDFMSVQHSFSVEQSEANIAGIVTRVQAQGMQVVICGGPRYANLARKYGASWVSCYDRSHLIDGVHFDATGHHTVAAELLPVIEGFLKKTSPPVYPHQGSAKIHCRFGLNRAERAAPTYGAGDAMLRKCTGVGFVLQKLTAHRGTGEETLRDGSSCATEAFYRAGLAPQAAERGRGRRASVQPGN